MIIMNIIKTHLWIQHDCIRSCFCVHVILKNKQHFRTKLLVWYKWYFIVRSVTQWLSGAVSFTLKCDYLILKNLNFGQAVNRWSHISFHPLPFLKETETQSGQVSKETSSLCLSVIVFAQYCCGSVSVHLDTCCCRCRRNS